MTRRGTRHLPALTCAAAFLLAGCGNEEAETPDACFGGANTYLTALEAAPGDVRLGGSTPISDCLVDDQAGGELGQVSPTIIEAATSLNRDAQDDPSGDATVQLGYLVGAVQEGASDTGGIHVDLIRRLDAAARFTRGEPLGVEFERAFGEGYAAGQETG